MKSWFRKWLGLTETETIRFNIGGNYSILIVKPVHQAINFMVAAPGVQVLEYDGGPAPKILEFMHHDSFVSLKDRSKNEEEE